MAETRRITKISHGGLGKKALSTAIPADIGKAIDGMEGKYLLWDLQADGSIQLWLLDNPYDGSPRGVSIEEWTKEA